VEAAGTVAFEDVPAASMTTAIAAVGPATDPVSLRPVECRCSRDFGDAGNRHTRFPPLRASAEEQSEALVGVKVIRPKRLATFGGRRTPQSILHRLPMPRA
jgi:hypothetical protein